MTCGVALIVFRESGIISKRDGVNRIVLLEKRSSSIIKDASMQVDSTLWPSSQ